MDVQVLSIFLEISPYAAFQGRATMSYLTLLFYIYCPLGQAEELSLRGVTPSTSFEDDDPSREKEAELILEYIEKFSELLDDRRYEEAAIHAANSPKGILRTPETLNRFKGIR